MMRAFIAIEMPEAVRHRISSISSEIRSSGVSIVQEQNMHITLLFLGDVPEPDIERIKARLSGIKASRFSVSVEGISAFGGMHPKVIFADVSTGAEEISALHNSISDRMSDLVKADGSAFTPHATIARVRQSASDAAVKEFVSKHRNDKFGEFVCEAVALKSSKLGNGPPEYTTLCSVGLAP